MADGLAMEPRPQRMEPQPYAGGDVRGHDGGIDLIHCRTRIAAMWHRRCLPQKHYPRIFGPLEFFSESRS